jgi:hypothetical protein
MAEGVGDWRIDKLYADMYEGDGKENQSMTTRMALMESYQEESKRNSAEARDDAKWNKRFAIGQTVAIVIFIIAHLLGWKI